jgi:SAM-dependent methyltransferase
LTAIVTRGDAAHLHLPDETVDLVVTSPPYWSLRSYQDGGAHMGGQIGDEDTADEYVDNLIDCTREWVRTLKPSGSLFVNLGDKYGPDKGLLMLPQEYARACRRHLGLILRAEIIWSKPNGLPESVTDRVRRSHEQVFHFVKQPRYYTAVDEIREDVLHPGRGMAPDLRRVEGRLGDRAARGAREADRPAGDNSKASNALGKLPGSVWSIPTAPLMVPDHLGVDHFAAFPPELVRRIVLGWSPREVCTACGEGRRPVSKRDPIDPAFLASNKRGDDRGHVIERGVSQTSILRIGLQSGQSPATRITGWACGCPDTSAPATPGVCLDPFGGTGTTALVASAFGRVGISVDLSADYCRLAQWRTTDRGELARVLGVSKPEPVAESQLGLFEGLG